MPDVVIQLAETLAAFANGRGGSLTLPSVQPGPLIERILRATLRTDPPLVIPLPKATTLDGKPAVCVVVPPGLPHVYAVEGRYLVRENDLNQPLAPARLRRLLLERGELTFEDEIMPDGSEADLDWEAAEGYAEKLGTADARDLLVRRGCLRIVDGMARPTHAGMLLFGKDVTRYVRGAFITAVRFAGVEMGDLFTRAEISGSLPTQIRMAETFLIDHLRKDVQLTDTMQRRERTVIPLEAAREVVVNAVAHRDYSIQGDGIRLYLFADRLEVTSPGKLPGPVTVENMVEERFSRNSIIVQVLSDLGFIERLGYGIDRVLSLMKEDALPTPTFTETSGGFRAVLYSEQRPTDFALAYPGITFNPRQQNALDYLMRNATITNGQFQALCPDVHAETLRRDLADLVSKNVIERLGEKRGSYYVLGKRGGSDPKPIQGVSAIHPYG